MKPTHRRLTCRAHNRFSPSIALWQHFLAVHRPLPSQQRPSSSAASAAQNGPGTDEGGPAPQPAPDVVQPPDTGAPINPLPVESGPRIVRKRTSKGEWYANKRDASIAKNIRLQYAARKSAPDTAERLLAVARAAYQADRDYRGVVVQPIPHPTRVDEGRLPWALPPEERSIPGISRLAIEIDNFAKFIQPNHYETIARRHVIDQVRNHVQRTLPNHQLEIFGSERTGLALATSDIDFRLFQEDCSTGSTLGNLPPSSQERRRGNKNLQQLYKKGVLKQNTYLLQVLRFARYPLVAFQDRESGIVLQIVLSNDTSLPREIMREYMEQYPYLRDVYFVIRTMLDVRGLTDVFKGGFGSYTLFMMIVASIRHKPHPKKNAAGALLNFLKFYRNFDTTKHGLSIEPVWKFDKGEQTIITGTTKAKIESGKNQPLPKFMLCLRDPADATNDLGRKAIAIRHFQATLKSLCYTLDRDTRQNTRISLLAPLVGPSYMLYKESRGKLSEYGKRLSDEMKRSLAAKAKMVREGVDQQVVVDQVPPKVDMREEERRIVQVKKLHLAREWRDKEWRRLTEERDRILSEKAERMAAEKLRHAVVPVLDMPSITRDRVDMASPEVTQSSQEEAQSAPESCQSSPESSLTLPEDSQSPPEGSLTLPEDSQSPPEGSLSSPEDSQSSPEGSLTLPEDSQSSPEGSLSSPEKPQSSLHVEKSQVEETNSTAETQWSEKQ